MNKVIIILTTIMLTGCGMVENLQSRCESSDVKSVCELIVGSEDVEQNKEIELLNRRLTDLAADFNSLSYGVNMMSSEVATLSSLNESLQFQMDQMIVLNATGEYNLQSQIDSLSTQILSNNSAITSITTQLVLTQQDINDIVIDVAELSGYDGIKEVIDPCGDYPGGFDEVILRTTSGKLLAYFESGTKRFLSVIPVGSYSTTDGSSCGFTVNGSGMVCSSVGCE